MGQVWRLMCLLVLLAGSVHELPGQSPPLWGSLVPGPFDAGFGRIWTVDHSRVWPRSPALDSVRGDVARPLRIDVWYPADCHGAKPMPLRGYVDMEAPDSAYADLVFLTRRWDDYSYRNLAGDSTSFDRLMGVDTGACRHPMPAPGPFPLVVYSAGWYNRTPDNAILAEYLASHGFVVASVPQLNPGLWTFEFASDAVGVENQVRDLEVALGRLVDAPFVDRRKVVAMGYSTGGDVALLLAGRNPLVKAVVALDGSWTLSKDNEVTSSPLFRPGEHREAILVLRRPADADAPGGDVLDGLSGAPRVVVEIPGGDHGTFSDDPTERSLLGMGTPEQSERYVAMARSVERFLDSVAGPLTSFDGAHLAAAYRADGLPATFLPPAPE